MPLQCDDVSKNSKKLLKFLTDVVVVENFLLCVLVGFLINDPELVLLRLKTGSLIKICNDVTGSAADDGNKIVYGEVGAHSSSAVSDGLVVGHIRPANQLNNHI